MTLRETRMTESDSGFSTSIRIPNKQSGFLTKFIIQGKKVGEPGLMVCYVIKGNKDVVKELANNINSYLVGSTIGTHVGPGVVGFAFFEK